MVQQNLTDLRELKSFLDIDPNDTQEDLNLQFWIAMATDWIGEFLGRPDLGYRQRSEYYCGTNTKQLLLRNRPVRLSAQNDGTPNMVVQVNRGGWFGSTSGLGGGNQGETTTLTYGIDYCLAVDQPVESDGSTKSRSGILINIKNVWEKPFYRSTGMLSPFIGHDFGSIFVQYWGGYTVDDLPERIRLAANTLVANIRYLFPLGVGLSSESYEERSVSIINERKSYLMGLVIPMLLSSRNWKF